MNNAFMRRASVVCLGLAAIAILMVLAPRAGADSSGVLNACVNPGNGMMRLVNSSADCHANETFVSWNIQGPQGPQGPAGSSSGGPPFVWVCTPGNYDLGGSGNNADLDIFNGSGTTANISAHFLSNDGTNLAGQNIPGSNPVVQYPGQTGNATVTLAPQNTMILNYLTGAGVRNQLPSTLLSTIVVTSDQPIVVGYNIPFGALQATPCSLLPK